MKQRFLDSFFGRIIKTVLPILLSFLLFSIAGAQTEDQSEDKGAAVLFEQANNLHTQREFQQAAELYSSIITKYGVSAPLLYNLANSSAAAGKVGQAVLNYERA
ncbi:MAG: hypothetical protein D3909_11620, partial [Candidatus Electrothrix sp. ATG1]|nr:hypothetical protein [Candidatus Electrothrix sp. ATG1]